MEQKKFKSVEKSVRKKDSMQLLTGKPVYVDDITPKDALVVKLLRSPHPNALVQEIRTEAAKRVPGVVDTIHGRMSKHRLPLPGRPTGAVSL